MVEPEPVQVPFIDLGAAYRELQPELDDAWAQVMSSGWYLLGPQLESFEAEFASHAESAHAVGVGSGLDALTLALRALGVGPGHEVIVPSNTFIATWLAVSAVGAVPVPVDPDPTTHNITAAAVAEAMTDRTRAVIPVHLYGRPVDLAPIMEAAHRYGCVVVEDAAQAHGARYRGRRIGAMGDAVCWSFYPAKNLGAYSDGGAVTTDSVEVAERIRSLRNYGSPEKYVHEELGVNSRLDELQAAFLRVKLRHLDDWNSRRSRIAARYLDSLGDIEGLDLPAEVIDAESSWHLFVVRHRERDRLHTELGNHGIQTLVHYPTPPHRQKAYGELGISMTLPVADRLAAEVLSLPIGPHLSDADMDRVTRAVQRACN